MRNFFGYTTDGLLYWQLVKTGGFPAGCDLDDPSCTDPLAVKLRQKVAASNVEHTLGGIVEFNCDCSCTCGKQSGVCVCQVCGCPSDKKDSSYYDIALGALVDKPNVTTVINSSPIENNSTTVLPPSSLFTVKLEGASVPDGEAVTLYIDKLHANDNVTLTFTDGKTNEVTFRAPAQGLTGCFTMVSKYVTKFTAFVKGFE